LGDGTRVLTRTMKKIEQKAGGLKRKVRDRMRSVRKRVLAALVKKVVFVAEVLLSLGQKFGFLGGIAA
jgi:hypothetical protein